MPDYKHLENTTWCSMAWMHQFIDPQGRVKPCCRFSMPKDTEQENNLNKQSLSDIFYGDFMNDVREKMINNQQVPGCIRCYQEEASGKFSLRERYNQMPELHPDNLIDDLSKPDIRWMELAISNDCNLVCRMCDSRYAWKWFEDEKELVLTLSEDYKKNGYNVNLDIERLTVSTSKADPSNLIEPINQIEPIQESARVLNNDDLSKYILVTSDINRCDNFLIKLEIYKKKN